MDECFRFLINVDQCLNMSAFDMFFYRLEQAHKYRLNRVQRSGTELSFRQAFQDIRIYLNKYPWHFREYQLIIAMHSPWEQVLASWEGTLLCRLMQLKYELHCQQLCLAHPLERALTLFTVYESDPHQPRQTLPPALSGERLELEVQLLFDQLGLCGSSAPDPEQLRGILHTHRDTAVGFFAEQFLASLDRCRAATLRECFCGFLQDQFADCQAVELWLPRDASHSVRDNTLAMIAITEFVNQSVQRTAGETLISRCRKNWEAVRNCSDLEQKYSDMLLAYEQRLERFHHLLETDLPARRSDLPVPELDTLPISDPDSPIEKTEHQPPELLRLLDAFLETRRLPIRGEGSWSDTHQKLVRSLTALEEDLGRYADGLSRQYSRRVEIRKKEALHRKSLRFFADAQTEDQIAVLQAKRDACLQLLQQPDMTPSLRFEDQDKVSSALQLANNEIRYLIRCLEAIKRKNFLMVGTTVLLGTAVHYTLLQPFVYGDIVSLPVFVLYLGIAALWMGLSWFVPALHYRRAIRNRVRQLHDELDDYVLHYAGRAGKFRTYINTLDQLDTVMKHLELYRQALKTTRSVQQGFLWHKARVMDHLDKVGALRGLIDRDRSCRTDPGEYTTDMLLDADGRLKDICQCSVYWPQERGERT